MDSGARFERIVGLQREIETAERRLAELATERKLLDSERINAEDLHRTLAEFDAIWSSLTTAPASDSVRTAIRAVRLIGGGPFDVIDLKHFDGGPARFQLEPELLLDGSKKRRAGGIGVGIEGVGIAASEAGLIDNGLAQDVGKSIYYARQSNVLKDYTAMIIHQDFRGLALGRIG